MCNECVIADDCPAATATCEAATCDNGICGVGVAPNGTSCPGDGVFCNGAEICEAGNCVSPGDPCPGPDGDDDCSETCHEAADNCSGNDPKDTPCDDGLFCTGTDQCNPNGNCSQHFNVPCQGPDGDSNCEESCSEANNNCDANDPDGTDCNGNTLDLICCSQGACTTASSCNP
jgi:hypothetical protein